ncbi:MAG: TauD/TfdA family dioxygenase [Candidatus Paracaedibacteraceae bacterium]|nr:TauD/TfdA family dioxygenase [Candidatus Paracaedibacteraceae bacterium]
MQEKVNIDLLLKAASSHLISFTDLPISPVIINDTLNVSEEDIHEIVDRYINHGFAIVHIVSERPSPETIISLGHVFELGKPFVPPLYTMGEYKASPIAKISTQGCSATHPIFQREVEVKLHCDGTLQKIGFVKTTVMLCEMPGAKGGENIFFNATAAYAELLETDLDAAIAMATHGSLIRQANINGCSDKNIGPVFSVDNGKLICNYSVTETDKFVAASCLKAADLGRGVEYMRKASQPGGAHYCQVRLEANQAIIFSNAKLAHGRKSYHNALGLRRCLYRGLFLNYPKVVNKRRLKISV